MPCIVRKREGSKIGGGDVVLRDWGCGIWVALLEAGGRAAGRKKFKRAMMRPACREKATTYHSATGIIPKPVLLGVVRHDRVTILDAQFAMDIAHQGLGVVAMARDGRLRDLLQLGRVKDVRAVDVPVADVEERDQQGEDQEERGEGAGLRAHLVVMWLGEKGEG